jgi:hypothetical protein
MNRRDLIVLGAASLLPACPPALALFDSVTIVPSGKVIREKRTPAAFTAIDLSLHGLVEVRQATPASVLVEADDNLLPEIESVVMGGVLKLRFKRPLSVTGRSVIRIVVTAPEFTSFAISGSGDMTADALKARAFSVAIAGSGDVRLAKLEADSLAIAVSGSGDFKGSGRANGLQVKIVGSGNVDAARIEARQATVSIAGSGNAVVWAREKLSASIAGSGDVRYHGDPAVTRSVAGSGSVKRLGPAP